MAKQIPNKVIKVEGVALQFRVPEVLIMQGRTTRTMSAADLLKKENKEILDEVVAGALEAKKEVFVGWLRNEKGEQLDTQGGLYAETWKKGARPGEVVEVRYGNIFKAASLEKPAAPAKTEGETPQAQPEEDTPPEE